MYAMVYWYVILKANRLILMPTLCRKMTKSTKIVGCFTNEELHSIGMLAPLTLMYTN